jgi:hypothetical protein
MSVRFSLTLRQPFTQGRFLVVISVRDLDDLRAIVQLEVLGQLLLLLLCAKLISKLLIVVLSTRFFTKDYGFIWNASLLHMPCVPEQQLFVLVLFGF